jgi:predicted 2-oxoglutarate/Fe(II)-dependent dioxygenase YbiX
MAGRLLLDDVAPTQDFRLKDSDPCFCASGRSFARCCGSRETPRPPPHGIFVVENYLDPLTVEEWVDFAEQCGGERLMVIDRAASTPQKIVRVEDSRRVADRVELGACRSELSELVAATFVDLAQKCLGLSLDWYEAPELMRYLPGGFYVKHADSQNFNPDSNSWAKVIDRDLSLLIYLNEDFEGGSLYFNRFNYRLRPKAGMAVLFPSDNRYIHTAETVTKGTRYAIVSWASVRGVPKVAEKPPEPAILLS